MCENKEIYASIETARVFYDDSEQQAKVFQEDSLKIINLLKVINYIINLESYFVCLKLMGTLKVMILINI